MKVDNPPRWNSKWNSPDGLTGKAASGTEYVVSPETIALAKRVLVVRERQDAIKAAQQCYIDQPSHAPRVEFNAAHCWFASTNWYAPKS